MDLILKVESLSKHYGSLRAVHRLSFEVIRGEIFGFLGPNGAGKTTSLKMLSGLLKPDSGKVNLLCSHKYRSAGLCPQEIMIWEKLSCLEQLIYMGRMYNLSAASATKKVEELLQALGLMAKAHKLAGTLSGGMQRRLNIALALTHDPEILFLDEPQAGLDPQSRILVRDYIRSIKKRTTVILTTHDMEEAEKLSDRICIIDHGSLLRIGTTDEIKKAAGPENMLEVEIDGNIENALLPYLNLEPADYRITGTGAATITMTDQKSLLERLLATIRHREICLKNLQLRKRSLEDVFITLTGRNLRE